MKLGEWLANNLLLGQSSEITEDVKLPINVGDTVMMGRFKNKKVKPIWTFEKPLDSEIYCETRRK